MPATPRVSVCIPVYNGEQFLAETIRSVLDQSYRDFELVVLDNASTDGTGRIARAVGDPRLRVETNPTTIAQPDNWRAAVDLCRAPLVKLLCADDLLPGATRTHILDCRARPCDGRDRRRRTVSLVQRRLNRPLGRSGCRRRRHAILC